MTAISMPSVAERIGLTADGIKTRMTMLGITIEDIDELRMFRFAADAIAEDVVEEFYQYQLDVPEISMFIGDEGTLTRLKRAMMHYVALFFSGEYGVEYVDNRLMIGMTHAKHGIAPHLYVSSIYQLNKIIHAHLMSSGILHVPPQSVTKLFLFDIQIMFDSYLLYVQDEALRVRASVPPEGKVRKNKAAEASSGTDTFTRHARGLLL